MTEDMTKERSELSCRGREDVKPFRRVLAWRKLVFRLVESVGQSKRRNCEDENIVAMMCIGKRRGMWLSRIFSILQAIAELVCTR
jgi:precorrin-6x reductase